MRERSALERSPQPEIPRDLLNRIRERAGLTAADHVLLGVQRAMARADVTDPLQYQRLIDRDPRAFAALITELTVGETYFLRESGQFEFVAREVLPALRSSVTGGIVRAWSAGCASGEEAYSLAIVSEESQPRSGMRVLGTDIAESRLVVARQATYGEWSLRGVPRTIIDRYFERAEHRVRVTPAIRAMVEFRSLNLAGDGWEAAGIRPGSMDLIFCRNVLIYLDSATTARIARRFMDSLSRDGWLFLGASDPALAELVDCEVVVTGSGLAYRRREPARRRSSTETLAEPSASATPVPISVFEQRPMTSLPASIREPASEAVHGARTFSAASAAQKSMRLRDVTREAYQSADYFAAAAAAREAVALDDTDPAMWILLVRSLANLGRHEEAGLACASGLDTHRTSAELTYLHAMLLRQSGKNGEASDALRCAIYLDRNLVVAHLAMGDVLIALGERDGARRAFRTAERLLATSPTSLVVPAADGLDAGRLIAVARTHLRLLETVTAQ